MTALFFRPVARKIASPWHVEKRRRHGAKMRMHRALRHALRRLFRRPRAAASQAENTVSGDAGGGIWGAIVR